MIVHLIVMFELINSLKEVQARKNGGRESDPGHYNVVTIRISRIQFGKQAPSSHPGEALCFCGKSSGVTQSDRHGFESCLS